MKSFVRYNLFQHFQVFFVLLLMGYFNFVAGNELTPTNTSSDNNNNIECSNNYVNGKHFKHKCNKFNAEYLMAHTFDVKVSDDIDMDPCKSGGFMGDIALPNINYESQWQTQKLNKSFQQELEKMKQEVYHEGLQVEEEGLTDIIRKKTKLPNSETSAAAVASLSSSSSSTAAADLNERNKNDPALLEPSHSYQRPHHKSGFLQKISSIEDHFNNTNIDSKSLEINATILDSKETNTTNAYRPNVGINSLTITLPNVSGLVEKLEKNSSNIMRNIDHSKIQSDTKDILYNSGDNILQLKKVATITTTTAIPTRTTLSKTFSNSGGNGGTLDDVQTLTADAAVRKRHRRRRQGRKNSKDKPHEKKVETYQMRLDRLKEELNRPVITSEYLKRSRLAAHESSATHSKLKEEKLKDPDSMNETTKDWVVNDMPPSEKRIDELNDQDKLTKKQVTLDTILEEITTQMPLIDENGSNNDRLKELQHHHRITRAATAKKERIWDYGVIPYEIDANFSGAHKALFKQAMRHWENFTCIKFVERNPAEHPNFITFTVRACGCCSFVGKRGNGGQAISIGKNCDKFGIVVHELGHVVGFWHEHTRPDRENHVVIERGNIMIGQEYNFNKLTSDDVNSLGLPYDYDSIMHYARNTFSKGTYLDTILPTEIKGRKRPEIGQRLKLSEGDIAQANLLYKCPMCGRTFQENSASFTSPKYYSITPSADDEFCEWRITATHGEKIILNITDLDIFKSNNCRSDYLEIRDGYWHKSAVLGRYCGSGRIQQLIKSTGSRMLLTFVSSHRQIGHRGFAANYEAVCGGELNLESGGRLESPNYPLDYLPNKECIWRITVQEEYQVALKFQSFEVENHDNSVCGGELNLESGGRLESPNYPLDYLPNKECIWRITVQEEYQVALKFQSFEVENHDNCVYDYVEVRDGDSPESRLIGVFCGYKVPPDMRSTTNKMFVKFVSDGSVQKAGFSATFIKELDECELQDHGCEHECINTLGGYQCSCFIGYELHSDKKSCENACGGVIDALNGTITSPSFPDLYPMLKECIWEIIAPEQYRITINFTHFDLEGNNLYQQECDYDSLSIYSKLDEDNLKRHGIFCGGKIPPLVTSEGNAMRIEFRSDNTVQKSGFAAVFFTDIDECAVNNGGCMHECKNTIGSYTCSCHNGYILHDNGLDCKEGGCKYEITAPHGQIYSPNYPDYYPPRKDCVWHFSTTPGHRIKLVFTVFEMEPHQECAYDHVAIYNGDSPESFSLGRFCGSKIPHPIAASSNEMFMVFKSDVSVQRGGFAATHSTVCGGHLTATTRVKHFYSHAKFGDFNYDNQAECDWTIEAEMGRNVQLTFLTFDIEEETSCSYDYVDVYGGQDDYSGPLYGRYCGSNPPDIISINEALLVRFHSDGTVVFKGFSASYVAVDPFEGSEEMNSDSAEMATPFPGYFKSIYVTKLGGENEDEDEEDYNEYDNNNYNNNKYKYKKSEKTYNRLSAEQFD